MAGLRGSMHAHVEPGIIEQAYASSWTDLEQYGLLSTCPALPYSQLTSPWSVLVSETGCGSWLLAIYMA